MKNRQVLDIWSPKEEKNLCGLRKYYFLHILYVQGNWKRFKIGN